MGQGKRNSLYINQCFAQLKKVGEEDPQAQAEGFEKLCEQWVPKAFEQGELAAFVYNRAFNHHDTAVPLGLERFANQYLALTWQAPGAKPYTLTLGLVCEVQPTALDVIAGFDEVESLRPFVAQALGLAIDAVTVHPALHDFCAFDGMHAVLACVASCKHSVDTALGKHQNFRFGEEAAGEAVTRLLWVSAVFDSAQSLADTYARLAQEIKLEAPAQPAAYTLRTIHTPETQQASAPVKPLALGLPFSMLRDYTFHEGCNSLDRALAEHQKREGLADADLRLNVVVTEQEPLMMPEGVMARDTVQDVPDPQVAVLVGRSGTEAVDTVILVYEGPHCLLAVPAVLVQLASRSFADLRLGGAPL